MTINSKVQKSNPEQKELRMLRGAKLCGVKGFTLQPYISSFQLVCNYTSTKSEVNGQNLPRLPVPKLNDTLGRYLKTAKPFLNDEEFAVTTKLAKEFASEGGIGIKLQNLLEKRAEKHTNWLEEWWLNTAYLEYRDPVVVFSSPGLVFPFRKFNGRQDQLKYAAKTLLAAMDYKELIDNDKIPVEKMGKNPLDMTQYKKIFGTCRIPAEKRDKLSFNPDSNYVTVIHNNHIFHLDLWGKDGKKLSENQIVEALDKVMKMSETPTEDAIGILTSENRDNWATAYQILSKDSSNVSSLRDVERSACVLCLDSAGGLWSAPAEERRSVAAAHTIHGAGSGRNGANRWFDKTVQFIVGADGITGLTYEHSPAEGQPIAVLTDFLINYIDNDKTFDAPSTSPIDPVKLQFNVNPEVKTMIKNARNNLDKLANNLELNCFQFDRYGKDFIKSHKMSPDSYLQMAMQYAFYSLHKTAGAHYESAATRMYAGGRTETIRSCSVESVRFARDMLDANLSPKDKLASMRAAVNAHKDYTVLALQGYGVDRHLLGLKLTAIENGIALPKLYSDPGYVRSAHMRISTSQVANSIDSFMCYGPLVNDGYATCYNPRARDVNFATAAFVDNPTTSCRQYRAALERALADMHDVLLANTASKL